MCKEIKLSQGKFTIVDDEDFDDLNKNKWYCSAHGYAVRNIRINKERKAIEQMHVQIIGKRDDLKTDHINGNRLDNRKINLRFVTSKQNNQNRASKKISTSKFKGIYWYERRNKWIAQIKIGDKKYHLGCYDSEQDAAYVYNCWAESFFGEYARLNVINM